MRFSPAAVRLILTLCIAGAVIFGATDQVKGVGIQVTALDDASEAKWIVPADNSLGTGWTLSSFDDSSWQSGDGPFGFGYSGSLSPTTDLQTPMQGVSSSAYFRFEFDLAVAGTAQVEALSLSMFYDDGFAAYLNGTLVASSNAPGTLSNTSTATTSRTVLDTDPLPEFDLAASISLLNPGTNTLAIHGLNASAADGDFLIAPVLQVTVDPVPEPRVMLLLFGSMLLACRRRAFRR